MMPIEKGLGSWAPAGGARVSARHPPHPPTPHTVEKNYPCGRHFSLCRGPF